MGAEGPLAPHTILQVGHLPYTLSCTLLLGQPPAVSNNPIVPDKPMIKPESCREAAFVCAPMCRAHLLQVMLEPGSPLLVNRAPGQSRVAATAMVPTVEDAALSVSCCTMKRLFFQHIPHQVDHVCPMGNIRHLQVTESDNHHGLTWWLYPRCHHQACQPMEMTCRL
jgi:hypothetical protein